MPPKVRQRGKKPSKLRKLQQEQEEQEHKDAQPLASTSSSTTNQIQSQADFIALDGDDTVTSTAPQQGDEDGQPNWVKLGERSSKAEHEAPFGYVDAELKAYLRAGWERVVELESQGYAAKSTLTALATASSSSSSASHAQYNGAGEDEEDDELALLLQATLKEMDGKELLLSTDPDTSLIVEGILHRLPAKPLRVFVDRLAGNFAPLAKHRFASHVVQACLATLQPAVTLEHATPQHFQQQQHRANGSNGKAAASSAYASDTATIVNEDGILRSATQLILDVAEELSADQILLTSLVTDAFGSHVLRSLLCVLTGRNIQTDPASTSHAAAASDLRSRRSAKYRTRKAPTAPAGTYNASASSEDLLVVIPDLLYNRAAALRQEILEETSVEVVRRWATDAVASPLLQLLIEAEADSLDSLEDVQRWKGTLVDSLLNGFVSSPPTAEGEEDLQKDVYLETSLRDSVASHALQLALERAPASAASRFFSIYIRNRMAKLCVHPAANHIVATLIRRLSATDLAPAVAEMAKIASGMVKEQMVGCLQAAVDRVVQLTTQVESEEEEAKQLVKSVSDVVLAAFRLRSKSAESEQDGGEELKLLVPAVLALKTRKAYLHTYGAHLKKDEAGEEGRGAKRGRDGKAKHGKKHSKSKDAAETSDKEEETPWTMEASYELPPSESTLQGSLLLQSLLRLPGPAAPPRAPPKRTFGRPVPKPSTPPVESWGSTLVLDSLLALPTLTPFARNPVSVHILISSLSSLPSSTSSTVFDRTQSNRRRKLSSALTNSLPEFCGDKYGSRLADQLWYSVDGYSKEKIARMVIEHSHEILKTQYASYFTNKLNLQLYRKGKIREWTQAVQAQQPAVNKVDAGEAVKDSKTHRPMVVETKRPKEKTVGKKGKKDKVDGELDSILDQI
ncbi:related to NOP9 - essential subunit of U3-containing 90S pre-ribosome [Ustilago trichophora]|uniref:Nucleolar protein 9 n=1 Tax=Ustilago trichophora TaxID=86804 RepID=A0A5C3DZS6_9BASI|nr:related to NOP9 - essential subunit of U3-containing 90S pre-ribosome [Ustilago trichophora]